MQRFSFPASLTCFLWIENVWEPVTEHSINRVRMASCLFWMFRWALPCVLKVTKAEAVPRSFSGNLKSFGQTLPFTWAGLTAQLTNLSLMSLNLVHVTETINIKARARVTAPHLLPVCTRQGLPCSASPFCPYEESARVWWGNRGTQGCRVTFPKSLLHCGVWSVHSVYLAKR